jgi:precorrin-6B methylase 2
LRRSRADLPLARTFSAARWAEYDILLASALDQGWAAIDLERWIEMDGPGGRVLIVRHDVDQHPAAAVQMARIDARHGVSGTWYFRWRTCSLPAIEAIRELGGKVGFHYESLTRLVRERKLRAEQVDAELIDAARRELRRELELFQRYVGPIESACAHGDTRVPGVTNQVLMQGIDPADFGVGFDANLALSRHRLGLWMTDRSAADGGWKDRIDPLAVVKEADSPVLCLTHPNNWCSGAALWADRLKSAILPTPALRSRRPLFGLRTGTDRPPTNAPSCTSAPEPAPSEPAASSPTAGSFAPVVAELRRELVRQRYEQGTRMESVEELELLDRETAVDDVPPELERALAAAGIEQLGDLELLELGSGFGALSLLLASRGARLTAVEADRDRAGVTAKVAQAHAIELELRGDDAAATLGSGRFDAAIVNDDGRGLPGPEVLARVFAALRPGGALVLRHAAPSRATARRLRRQLQRTGFDQVEAVAGYLVARRPAA